MGDDAERDEDDEEGKEGRDEEEDSRPCINSCVAHRRR